MGCGLHVLLVYRDGIRAMDYSYCWYIGLGYGIQAMDYSYIGMGMGYRLWVMDCMYYWYVDMGYGLQLYRDGWGVSYRYELWSMGICVGYVRLG